MRSHIVNWKTKLSSIVICFMIFCLLFGCFELGECKKEEDSCQMDVKFSTYLGGTGLEGAGRISLDSSGNIILAASSSSNDFPLVNPFQATKNITEDGVIAKVSPDGQELLFSTYFGGNGDDFLFSTAVDSNDNIIVAGTTDGTTFPLKNALKTNRSASSREVVLAKFSPDGQELYFSTFICGTNSYTVDIVLDSSDNIILGGCTDTEELLATANTYQPNKNNSTDGFITKISADGQTVLFSTYLGGNTYENFRTIELDSDSNIIIAGYTNSDDFPVENSLCNRSTSDFDSCLSKVSANGQDLLFSTYYGGTPKSFRDIAVDTDDNIIYVGQTNSLALPVKEAYQTEYGGGDADVFVAKINVDDYSVGFSTFLGGSGVEEVFGVLVDNHGDLIITGASTSVNFPLSNEYQTFQGVYDVYICKMDKSGQQLEFSTYYGGSQHEFCVGSIVDTSNNDIIIFGHTGSLNFPVVNAYQDIYHVGYDDMFLCKFSITDTSNASINPLFLISSISVTMLLMVFTRKSKMAR